MIPYTLPGERCGGWRQLAQRSILSWCHHGRGGASYTEELWWVQISHKYNQHWGCLQSSVNHLLAACFFFPSPFVFSGLVYSAWSFNRAGSMILQRELSFSYILFHWLRVKQSNFYSHRVATQSLKCVKIFNISHRVATESLHCVKIFSISHIVACCYLYNCMSLLFFFFRFFHACSSVLNM